MSGFFKSKFLSSTSFWRLFKVASLYAGSLLYMEFPEVGRGLLRGFRSITVGPAMNDFENCECEG